MSPFTTLIRASTCMTVTACSRRTILVPRSYGALLWSNEMLESLYLVVIFFGSCKSDTPLTCVVFSTTWMYFFFELFQFMVLSLTVAAGCLLLFLISDVGACSFHIISFDGST